MHPSRRAGVPRRSIAGLPVLALLLATPAAVANSFGHPGNYAANNYNHEVYLASTQLDVDLGSATTWVTQSAYDPHPVVAAYVTLTYRSANDARVYSGNYGSTDWYAASPCLAGATIGGSGQGTWCKPRTVRYNRGYYPGAFDTENERRHFACHELGHTLGLFHDTVGCMSVSGVSYVVGAHDNAHLNFYANP